MALKNVLDSGKHQLSVLSGLRTRPPQNCVTHAGKLSGEAGVTYRVVVPSEARKGVRASQTNPAFDFLAHSPETACDDAFLTSPEAFLLTLPQGRLVAHGVATGDGRLIGDLSTESEVRAARVANHSLLRRKSIARYQFLPGHCLAVINAYTDNYYHWIMEAVPRLLLLRQYLEPAIWDKGPIVLNSASRPFQKEVIAYLGLQNRVVDTQQGSYLCEKVTVPAEAGVQILPASWSVKLARDGLKDIAKNASPSLYGNPKRIYVARGKTAQGQRHIVNEADLLTLLKAQGFTPIVPDGLSVGQQADIFSHAEMVVGVHGAGLSNLLFCQAGTRVVELFSPLRMAPCYFILALEAGLDYKMLQGEAVLDGAQSGAKDSNIKVDLDALQQALR